MLNCFSGVFTLTNNHKVDGDLLFVIGQSGDDVPTLCFVGKQRQTIEKWGKPGRVIAVAGALRTKVVNKSKMTYIEVAYSRFLDKGSEVEVVAAPKAAPAPAKAATKAPAAPRTKAPAKVKAAKAAPAPTTHVDDDLPWE